MMGGGADQRLAATPPHLPRPVAGLEEAWSTSRRRPIDHGHVHSDLVVARRYPEERRYPSAIGVEHVA